MSETPSTRPETVIGLKVSESALEALVDTSHLGNIDASRALDERASLHQMTAGKIERISAIFDFARDEGLSYIIDLLAAGKDEEVRSLQEHSQSQAQELYELSDRVRRHGVGQSIITLFQHGKLFDSIDQPIDGDDEITQLTRAPFNLIEGVPDPPEQAAPEAGDLLPRHARAVARYYNSLTEASPVERIKNIMKALRNDSATMPAMALDVLITMQDILEFMELGLEDELNHDDKLTRDLLITRLHNPEDYQRICSIISTAVGQSFNPAPEQIKPALQLLEGGESIAEEAAS